MNWIPTRLIISELSRIVMPPRRDCCRETLPAEPSPARIAHFFHDTDVLRSTRFSSF
jgi:hypothetical protein